MTSIIITLYAALDFENAIVLFGRDIRRWNGGESQGATSDLLFIYFIICLLRVMSLHIFALLCAYFHALNFIFEVHSELSSIADERSLDVAVHQCLIVHLTIAVSRIITTYAVSGLV